MHHARSIGGVRRKQKVSGRCITNLRYADDIVLIADTLEDLQDLVDRAYRSSKRAGLPLNAKKTKVLKVLSGGDNDDEKIFVNDEALEISKSLQTWVLISMVATMTALK